jgi:hypothetical protein
VDKPQPEGIQQRPRSGATRCPYCHDECEAGQEACACADCLSRHHLGCWDEAAGCSSCRSTNRLLASPETTESEASPAYGEVIDAWLKLGLIYNGGLGGLTLLLLNTRLLHLGIALEVLAGAVVANLCFLSGPVIELIGRRLGFKSTQPLRWTLFVVGFGLSLLLALASCLSLVLP